MIPSDEALTMFASTSSPRASGVLAGGREVGGVAIALVAPICQLPHEPWHRVAGAYRAQCANPRPIGLHGSCSRKAAATPKRVSFRWCVWWVSWSKVPPAPDDRVGLLYEPEPSPAGCPKRMQARRLQHGR